MSAIPSENPAVTPEPGHGRRIFLIWAVLAVIGDFLVIFVAGPHLPPGAMTNTARSQQIDMTVITATALPVTFAVWTYFAYALVTWRHPKGAPIEDGPPIRSNLKVQVSFIAATTVIVMSMFVYGTVELIVPAGAGGGEGSQPIWTPASHHQLIVQVIGQQWKWTYRYPGFGGFETDQLVLPNDTTVAFHVTSLDVIHDFWAYQLGAKADANPGSDNIAFTTTRQTGTFSVLCDELCGLWHGAMVSTGYVMSPSAFEQWATSTEASQAAATKLLPPFAFTYTPSANGAAGGYYPSTDPFSPTQSYGSASGS